MIVIVDTNIVFSGILSPEGTICNLLLNSSNNFDFYAPSALWDELNFHNQKLLKFSGLTNKEVDFLKLTIIKRINLIDLESIKETSWEKAVELTKEIDEFDIPFVALSIELDAPLWTGDKKLTNGLKRKGINWILNTEMLKQLL